jgi:hypothetical protein
MSGEQGGRRREAPRSILKKTFSDGTELFPKPKKRPGRAISFDSSVTMRVQRRDSTIDLVREIGDRPCYVASSGQASHSSSSADTRDVPEVANGERSGDQSKRSKFKSAISRTRVGSVLLRSNRRGSVGDVAQEGVADLEASGSDSGADGCGLPASRNLSAISASAEYQPPREKGLPEFGASLDSANLSFTSDNRSLLSRLVKFGRHFKPDFQRESDDSLPVLTKVTPLGGFSGVSVDLETDSAVLVGILGTY